MTQPTTAPSPTNAAFLAVNKLLKPGAKTTEFIGLVAMYAGALAALLGAFNTHSARMNAIIKVAALVAAAISHVGYALSRGDTKAALGSLTQALLTTGVFVPVTSPKHAKGDSGSIDLVGMIAGVFVIAGLIWMVVGFTHHTLDVFGLILLLVGIGIYALFSGVLTRGTAWRRRP